METLINRVRSALAAGLGRDEIINHFVVAEGNAHEDIFFAYAAAIVLDGPAPETLVDQVFCEAVVNHGNT